MTDHEDHDRDSYSRYNRRRTAALVTLAAIMIVSAITTLKLDVGSIPIPDIVRILIDRDNPANDASDVILIWNLYLPRIACGILAGFGLGIAGTVMQCVLRNPLGSPYTLGISNAAAFGAALGIVLGGGAIVGQSSASVSFTNPYFITICAFLWSMIATGVIIALVKLTTVSAETMVLAGVAISSIFSAGISALQYIFNDTALSMIVFWQFGSLGKAGWEELTIVAAVVLIASAFFIWKRWDFNALESGAEVAQSLGIDVQSLRLVSLLLSALVTSVIVSFMGVIAFIGLLGPHMIRLAMGNDHRYLLPGSMLLGAIILLISDCVGQTLLPFVLPVGIITSFLGGPLFLYLLVKGYRRKGATA
ncbi:MAG: iron ABC transporter permease [Candidatus Methanomethylophilaceae archaeon]|nr:iron ABC transporter permease [Candidatus Methanomethylophilaceae archaeon]